MLIARHQLEALRTAARTGFIHRATRTLRRDHASRCEQWSDARLEAVIHYGRQKAKRYGFAQTEPILALLGIMLQLGADFDDQHDYPWAREILIRGELSPTERVALLGQEINQRGLFRSYQ